MRFSRRPTNPIFVEDESHNWNTRRPLFLQALRMAGLTVGLITLVLLVVN